MDEWTQRDGVTHALGEALPLGSSWERRQPARVGDLRGDLLLPLGQAIVTATVGAIGGGILGGWRGAAIGGSVAFAVAWLALLIQTRAGLWTIERITGQDLDDDGAVGDPPNEGANNYSPTVVRVELSERHKGGQRVRFLDLPATDDKLRDVAEAIQDGASFSRRGLAEVLSQSQYENLATAMLDAGLAVDLPGNRRELSAAGRVLLRRLLE